MLQLPTRTGVVVIRMAGVPRHYAVRELAGRIEALRPKADGSWGWRRITRAQAEGTDWA